MSLDYTCAQYVFSITTLDIIVHQGKGFNFLCHRFICVSYYCIIYSSASVCNVCTLTVSSDRLVDEIPSMILLSSYLELVLFIAKKVLSFELDIYDLTD